MDHDQELSFRALLRDLGLDTRTAFDNIRLGSPRWQEIDGLKAKHLSAIGKAATGKEATAIHRQAIADADRIKRLDDADREAEHRRRNEIADSARNFALQTANKNAWRERASRQTVAAINTVIARLQMESSTLTGAVDSEADIRAHLSSIADALQSMKATIDLEVRASITRESDAAKAAAA